MSTSNDQDTKQAPAPFAVGQQVRCVDATESEGDLIRNHVYTVKLCYNDGGTEYLDLMDDKRRWGWLASRFVPAVPFVDREEKKWLVVDERRPKEGDYFIAHTDSAGENNIVLQDGGGDWYGKRRIVVPWQEFPAPAKKDEPTVSAPANWKARCEKAELDLLEHKMRGDAWSSVFQEITNLNGSFWSCTEEYSAKTGCECVIARIRAYHKAERERDQLRARVAELEAECGATDGITFDDVAANIRELHPTATSWQLFVNAQGYEVECKHENSTEGAAYKMLNGEWSPRAALAGKREGNNA